MYYDPGSSNLNTELSSMTPPDPPTREKKIPFEFTWKHLVIFMVLFVLMLIILYVVEMAAKASREAELQKWRAAEVFCLTHGLNRTHAELDDCIEVSLALSEAFDAGVSAEKIVEGLGSASYATAVSQSYATETSQSRATEISRWSATQISQIRQRIAEISQDEG